MTPLKTTNPKPWWASKTQLAAILAFLQVALSSMFVNFPEMIEWLADPRTAEMFAQIGSLVALLLVFYGRNVATAKIDTTRVLPGVSLKILVLPLLCAAMLGGVVATQPGCAAISNALGNPDATAREKYRDAVNGYDAAVSLAALAVETDVVDLETAEAMGRVEQAAYDELVLMRRSIEVGDLADFDDTLARFRRGLNSLRTLSASPPTLSVPASAGAP